MLKRKTKATDDGGRSRKRRRNKADQVESKCSQDAPNCTETPVPAPKPNPSTERLISNHPNEAYTVGWVCALPVELAAGQGMLDERHGEPQSHPKGDHNVYTLGRVGEFNVAMACLPADEYGTPSAANVVGAMWTTFPNLKIGLFVGVGAGIPDFTGENTRDIRLGDVVVGMRVVDYELGKRHHGGRIQSTGHQDKPPKILRSALNKLRADHRVKAPKISQLIEALTQKEPDCESFAFPNNACDQLCQPCLVGEECPGGRGISLLRFRAPRSDNDPRIHYGTVASGNTVCKDRGFREEIRQKFDAMCFDMEAAGVMNNFNGLVIRGISDYADCHKNDDWHPYAAACAAGYAKLLLEYVPLSVKDTGTSGDSPFQGRTGSKHWDHDEEDLEILNWLTRETFESRHIDHLSRLQEGTGQWFFSSSQFLEFFNGEQHWLACPGMPGAGKTMTSTLAIDWIRGRTRGDPNVAVCFIYFDYRVQYSSPTELVAIILRQLAEQQANLPQAVRALVKDYKPKNSPPSLRDLLLALESTLQGWSKVFLIVDAIDECPSSNGTRQDILKEIRTLQSKARLKVMVTSRPNPAIIDSMRLDGAAFVDIRARDEDVEAYIDGRLRNSEALARQKKKLQRKIRRQVMKAVDGMFLLAQLYLDRLSHMIIPRDIEDVIDNLPDGADVYAEAFSQAMTRIESHEVTNQQLAKRALSWITYARRPLKTKELQHALALRPTDTVFHKSGMPALKDILSICVGLVILDTESGTIRLVHYTTQQYFEDTWVRWFPDAKSTLAKTCIQYLSLDVFAAGPCVNTDEVPERLRKYSLYGYAANNWSYHAEQALADVQAMLLHFLNHDKKRDACCQATNLNLGGTGCHLAAHFDLADTIGQLLENGCDVNARDEGGGTPLSWAAANGSRGAVSRLLSVEGIDVNLQGATRTLSFLEPDGPSCVQRAVNARHSYYGYLSKLGYPKDGAAETPLANACRAGHEDIVANLLANGADPGSCNQLGDTPLHLCMSADYLDRSSVSIRRLLLQTGLVNVNAPNVYGQTPLSIAAEAGLEVVVLLLVSEESINIDLPITITSTDGHTTYRSTDLTAFSFAAESGHVRVMEILLATGKVNTKRTDAHGNSALLLAASRGRKEAVGVLLHYGEDPNQTNCWGQTALHLAVERKSSEVVQLLLQCPRTNSHTKDIYGRSELLKAAEAGELDVVRMLLSHKGSSTYENKGDGKQLIKEVLDGELEDVIECLQSGPPSLNVKASNGEFIEIWAADMGYIRVIEVLLHNGVDVNRQLIKDPYGGDRSTLLLAAEKGNIELVKLLLARGADPLIGDWDSETPLNYAVQRGHYAIAKLLMRHPKAHGFSSDSLGRALSDTARYGYCRLISFLIRHGADPNHKDWRGRSPLSYAVEGGSIKAVNILLKNGANRSARDNDGRTVLDWAREDSYTRRHADSCIGREEVIKLLKKKR